MEYNWFKGKNLVIIGGSGFLGSHLCKYFLNAKELPNKVSIISRCEHKQRILQSKFGTRIQYILGDITDYHSIYTAIPADTDYILHLAAMKYVDIAETNPTLTIKTNIIGTYNIYMAMLDKAIKNILFVSTDKACSPITIYGMTKYIGEKILLELGRKGGIIPYITRFGNLFGSTGSVVNIWKTLIENGKNIELTNNLMQRPFVTVEQAVDLINLVIEKKHKNQIAIPICKVVSLKDIANIMVEHTKSEIIYKSRCLEKQKEELISSFEGDYTTLNVMENNIINPQYYLINFEQKVNTPIVYNCDNIPPIGIPELKKFLKKEGYILYD